MIKTHVHTLPGDLLACPCSMLGPRVVVSIHVMYPRVVMIINLYTFRYVEVVIRFIDTLYMYVYKHMHARKYIHTRTHNARMHNAYTHMH